jgi:hypothetical protein
LKRGSRGEAHAIILRRASRSGLCGADIDSLGGKLGGASGRRRVGKRVVTMRRKCDVDEAGILQRGAKLSFQESAGNSAGPQGDVLFRIVWRHFAHHY